MPPDMLGSAWALRQGNQPFVLATVVRIEKPTSSKPGAKAIITPDGVLKGWVGGSCAEPTVKKEARKALESGQPRLIRLCPPENRHTAPQEGVVEVELTCISGGTLEIYLEPYMPDPNLVIVGHHQIVPALVKQGKLLGYRVTVISLEDLAESVEEADVVLDRLDFSSVQDNPNTFIVVCSHGNYDEIGLIAALNTNAPYVALVASKKRLEAVQQYLGDSELTAEQIARLKCPAGLDLGAVTQEEIALSILAEIIEVRRRNPVLWRPAEPVAEQGPAEAKDPVCGMMVDIATARYVSTHQEQKYYFCSAGCQRDFERDPEKYLVKD